MEYNTQRGKLKISEYGRNVQKMIDYTVLIEDREKRTRTAYAIVSIMSHLNPGVKDSTDYQRTLWDHMHIISGFRLDVDGPFSEPNKEELFKKPEKIPYSNNKIKYRHYGKNIQGIIEKAIEYEDGAEKEALIRTIANHLKKSYLNWNRESVNDETIAKHLSDLSFGKLNLDDKARLTTTSDILARNKPKKKKYPQKGKDNFGRRKGFGQRKF
jgi:Domain of unknown function (DUF4290)